MLIQAIIIRTKSSNLSVLKAALVSFSEILDKTPGFLKRDFFQFAPSDSVLGANNQFLDLIFWENFDSMNAVKPTLKTLLGYDISPYLQFEKEPEEKHFDVQFFRGAKLIDDVLTNNSEKIIEFVNFSVNHGVQVEQVLSAINNSDSFLTGQSGNPLRIVGKDNTNNLNWLDCVYWDSLEDAKNAAAKFITTESCLDLISMIEKVNIFAHVTLMFSHSKQQLRATLNHKCYI